jgi:hypothetical protein
LNPGRVVIGCCPLLNQLPSQVVEGRSKVLYVVSQYGTHHHWRLNQASDPKEVTPTQWVAMDLFLGERETTRRFGCHGFEGIAESLEVKEGSD